MSVRVFNALLLAFACSQPTSAVINVKIGFLVPWTNFEVLNDFGGATSAGAISIAIDKIKELDLVEEVEFEIVTRDSECNSRQAGGFAVDLYIEERVDVLIGPPCSDACLIAGQLASFWNIPIISWVATSPEFNDKRVYSTLGRSLGPFSKLGVFLLEIMDSYGWSRAVVIYSTYLMYGDAGRAIVKTFKERNVTIGYEVAYNNNPTDRLVQNILKKTSREGRIVVICAPKMDRRKMILEAHDRGMTNGEYVFYTVEMLPDEDVITAAETYLGDDDRNEDARKAFEAVFHMSLAALTATEIDDFTIEVVRRLEEPPWSMTLPPGSKGNKFAPFLYDAIILYVLALNQTVSQGLDYRDGTIIANALSGLFFKGMTGNVLIDEFGDREPDYWITDLQPNGVFVKISEVVNLDNGTRVFRQLREPRWPGGKVGHQYAPPDTPVCGFSGCKGNNYASIYVAAFAASFIVAGAVTTLGIWLYRRSKFEGELLNMRWKVHMEEVRFISGGSGSFGKFGSLEKGSHPGTSGSHSPSAMSKHSSSTSQRSFDGKSSAPSNRTVQYFARTATYRGVSIALKKINKEHIQVNRAVLLEFNEIRQLSHDNLNPFIGACVETGSIYLAWQYCAKGSLQDVLQNDDIKLDSTFKISFMTDTVKGMEYLHKSRHGFGAHGSLKSSNCLVDSRWIVKVTDYGLPSFVQGQSSSDIDDQERFMCKVWTAPEILRMNFPPPGGTQKGDVYSFAVIMYEIVQRAPPFVYDNITPRDVVNRIRNGESTPFRPTSQIGVEGIDFDHGVLDLMYRCWSESSDARPTFTKIRTDLKAILGKEINIVDNILTMMEKYSTSLEEIVEERTEQVLEEKRKTDRLLYRMLPSTVAEQLKMNQKVDPENFDNATIYFSDIVGFSTLSSESTPFQIVDFLNDLYRCFDDIISNYDIYKVETISDAYMIVSGLPHRNGHRHVTEIADCALDLLSSVTKFKIRHRPKQKLQLRIGVHTGPVVAGVVGLVMPRYCLFGDTVNIASRMESTGKACHIHISKQSYTALCDSNSGYHMIPRGDIDVKGKGMVATYFLHGKDGFKKPLPKISNEFKRGPNIGGDFAAEGGGGQENSIDSGDVGDGYKEGTADEPSTTSTLHKFA